MALPRLQPQPQPPAADRLRALGILALNGMFDEMDALGVLRQAATELLPGDLAVVSSFGADSAVLLHLVAQVDPSLPVYFLETGKHFVETLDYVETLKRHLGSATSTPSIPMPQISPASIQTANCGRPTRIRAAISARRSRWSR